MGKTTNILDLNNRLTKVEKGNVAQNNYNSLKNRPKINGNLLTGDKTGVQLGLAEAQDITDINTAIGNMSDLDTTATNLVGAVNEVVDSLAEVVYASANVGGIYTGGTEYKLNSFTIVDSGIYLIIGKQYMTPDETYNYSRPTLKINKNNNMIAQKVYAIKQSLDITSVIHCNSNDVISLMLICNNDVSNLNNDNTASSLNIVKLSNK